MQLLGEGIFSTVQKKTTNYMIGWTWETSLIIMTPKLNYDLGKLSIGNNFAGWSFFEILNMMQLLYTTGYGENWNNIEDDTDP